MTRAARRRKRYQGESRLRRVAARHREEIEVARQRPVRPARGLAAGGLANGTACQVS